MTLSMDSWFMRYIYLFGCYEVNLTYKYLRLGLEKP